MKNYAIISLLFLSFAAFGQGSGLDKQYQKIEKKVIEWRHEKLV